MDVHKCPRQADDAACILQFDSALEQNTALLSLPAEIRNHILEYVFDHDTQHDGMLGHGDKCGLFVNDDYTACTRLQPLLVCRQMYQDSSLLALSRTNFVVSNLFFNIPDRLSVLRSKQLEAIRFIAFVADARHFRKLIEWRQHPFGMSSLRLDSLTIVLHRSNHWHYLFDYTADIVQLLRSLRGVKRFVFVRNAALVKGSLKTWYNRLVGLILKTDHHERYNKTPPNPEQIWWKWSYDDVAQSISLEALPPKPMVDEQTYMQQVVPLMEDLRVSIENEEWNPDPRARTMYY